METEAHVEKSSRRAPAILALVVAFVAVVVVVAVSAGGSGGDDGSSGAQQSESRPATQQGQEAVARGFYVVGKGDTLSQIATDTGVDEDTITELNPSIDPQALIPGQEIRLR